MWISKQNPTAERDTIHIPEVDEGRFTGNHNDEGRFNCWEKPWFPTDFLINQSIESALELEISQTKPSSAGPKYTSNHIPTGLAHFMGEAMNLGDPKNAVKYIGWWLKAFF